jgi:hypothetical protein
MSRLRLILRASYQLWRRPDWSDDEIRPVAQAYWQARGTGPGSAAGDWDQAILHLRRYERLIRVLFVVSLLFCITVTLCYTVYQLNRITSPPEPPASSQPTTRPTDPTGLMTTRPVNPSTLPSFQLYGRMSRPPAELSRDKAVEFGLSQLSARMQSGMLGAGAVFWFAMKLLMENQSAKAAGRLAARWRGLLFLNVILWCSVSIGFGFLAMMYLTEVAIEYSLSVGAEIQVFQSTQVLTLAVAVILLIFGAAAVTLGRYPFQPVSQK